MSLPQTDFVIYPINREQAAQVLDLLNTHRPDIETFPSSHLSDHTSYLIVRGSTPVTFFGVNPYGPDPDECTFFTYEEFLAAINPRTNEDILTQFLEHHNTYEDYKQRLYPIPYPVQVSNSIMCISWVDPFSDIEFWGDLNRKWVQLCNHFNLTGTIDTSKLK